jgi:hypothetical protein
MAVNRAYQDEAEEVELGQLRASEARRASDDARRVALAAEAARRLASNEFEERSQAVARGADGRLRSTAPESAKGRDQHIAKLDSDRKHHYVQHASAVERANARHVQNIERERERHLDRNLQSLERDAERIASLGRLEHSAEFRREVDRFEGDTRRELERYRADRSESYSDLYRADRDRYLTALDLERHRLTARDVAIAQRDKEFITQTKDAVASHQMLADERSGSRRLTFQERRDATEAVKNLLTNYKGEPLYGEEHNEAFKERTRQIFRDQQFRDGSLAKLTNEAERVRDIGRQADHRLDQLQLKRATAPDVESKHLDIAERLDIQLRFERADVLYHRYEKSSYLSPTGSVARVEFAKQMEMADQLRLVEQKKLAEYDRTVGNVWERTADERSNTFGLELARRREADIARQNERLAELRAAELERNGPERVSALETWANHQGKTEDRDASAAKLPEPRDLDGYTNKVERDHVRYSRQAEPEKVVMRDYGHRIAMEGGDRDARKAALKMASERGDGTIMLRGTPQYQMEMAFAAHEMGLADHVTNPGLKKYFDKMDELKVERERIAQERKTDEPANEAGKVRADDKVLEAKVQDQAVDQNRQREAVRREHAELVREGKAPEVASPPERAAENFEDRSAAARESVRERGAKLTKEEKGANYEPAIAPTLAPSIARDETKDPATVKAPDERREDLDAPKRVPVPEPLLATPEPESRPVASQLAPESEREHMISDRAAEPEVRQPRADSAWGYGVEQEVSQPEPARASEPAEAPDRGSVWGYSEQVPQDSALEFEHVPAVDVPDYKRPAAPAQEEELELEKVPAAIAPEQVPEQQTVHLERMPEQQASVEPETPDVELAPEVAQESQMERAPERAEPTPDVSLEVAEKEVAPELAFEQVPDQVQERAPEPELATGAAPAVEQEVAQEVEVGHEVAPVHAPPAPEPEPDPWAAYASRMEESNTAYQSVPDRDYEQELGGPSR